MTPGDRFWSKTVPGHGGCVIWIGARSKSGYGNFKSMGTYHLAHRWAYEDRVGGIGEGLWIDHLCRVRNCVNPHHLEPVTPRENNNRANTVTSVNGRKEKCPDGHRYEGKNLIIKKRGNGVSRVCRTCANTKHRAGSSASSA